MPHISHNLFPPGITALSRKLSGLQLHFEFVLCYVLEIEFIEMCEPAVPAPDGKMPATYSYIMGTSHVTVSAFRGFKKVPDIVTPNRRECTWLSNIFNTGDKDPGGTTVFTRHLCLVRYCFYDLVCHLLAMVAVSAEFCENEPVAHGKYWMCPGSLICCTIYHQPERFSIGSKDIAQLIAFYYNPVVFDTISNMVWENVP